MVDRWSRVAGWRARGIGLVFFLGVLGLSTAFVPASNASSDVPVRAAARDGLVVGGMVSGYSHTWPDRAQLSMAAEQFDAVTAAAYLAWGAWPDPDEPVDTSGLDVVVDWARRNDLAVHGHTLVYPWANAQIDWWADLESGHEDRLEEFVTEMVSSNAGHVWVWDVVNEVMAPPGEPADAWGLRTDVIEYERIGPDYVDRAFGWARAADPDALLILNDYGAEEINEKSDRLLAYVIELRDRGVPIDGVGFQTHVWAVDGEPDWASIRANFQRFADAGFRIFITEVDVPIIAGERGDEPTADELERQRAMFEEVARIATDQPAVESLLLWDWVDESSWLHPVGHRISDQLRAGVYSHPAPWHRDDRTSAGEIVAKPAVDGLVEGLTARVRRTTPDEPRRLMVRVEDGWALLSRTGVQDDDEWRPAAPVQWTARTDESRTWLTTQWEFEAVTEAGITGFFRIRNRWESDTGWLARAVDGRVESRERIADDPTQWWRLEPLGDGVYRLVNAVRSADGVLTVDPDSASVTLRSEDSASAQLLRLYRS